ncbi:tRNA lysidine(34) synthetase TilS [Hydrogenimonas urashimensis]|uniref:tRNA lysidine(34) synthetase TilS n=1 Tax=Hydrogenimonas urashimensis TaxID=2740515 RepID=UPI001915FE09|nr:tRNA lysidine(34) synthetase TilS [Hydrogenimonas urashimensis]
MLDPEALRQLQTGKNLLAFSAGIDSTALYHLLKDRNIPFDIALLNYKTRPQSDEEAHFATKLAEKDGKRAFVREAPLDPESRGFEKKARQIRYDFFESLVAAEGYENLITAHQLDDMLEWSLMQLCKGCGSAEFVGMQPVERRESYTLVRPLLFTPKKALRAYLESRKIPYFVDRSNLEERYTRNRFRHQAAAFLMRECSEGIARSFRYMLADKKLLQPRPVVLFRHKELTIIERPAIDDIAIRQIDRVLKEHGYLLSKAQKEEILKHRYVVVGGKWVVWIAERTIWIAPYVKAAMPKIFRERCRRAEIPEKIRPYLFMTSGLERLLSEMPTLSS